MWTHKTSQLGAHFVLMNFQVAWSSITIGTTPLHLALPDTITEEFKKEIAEHTRGAAAAKP